MTFFRGTITKVSGKNLTISIDNGNVTLPVDPTLLKIIDKAIMFQAKRTYVLFTVDEGKIQSMRQYDYTIDNKLIDGEQ